MWYIAMIAHRLRFLNTLPQGNPMCFGGFRPAPITSSSAWVTRGFCDGWSRNHANQAIAHTTPSPAKIWNDVRQSQVC